MTRCVKMKLRGKTDRNPNAMLVSVRKASKPARNRAEKALKMKSLSLPRA